MHLRELLHILGHIPTAQDIDVSVRRGDVLSAIDQVKIHNQNGKLSIELLESHQPVKGRSLQGRTISDRREIERITGSQNRIQTRATA